MRFNNYRIKKFTEISLNIDISVDDINNFIFNPSKFNPNPNLLKSLGLDLEFNNDIFFSLFDHYCKIYRDKESKCGKYFSSFYS